MNFAKKLLLGKGKKNYTITAIWILTESVLYSLQSAILMLVITNVGGLQEAGLFTLAYTLTQMMATIGSFGMRSFQVSDTNDEYAFATYFTSRIISVFAMIFICIGYALLQGYQGVKMILVAVLCGYRVVDGMEDVFHGAFQKENRLDVAAKIASVKIVTSMVVFSMIYIFFRNLLLACIGMTLSAALISLVLNGQVLSSFQKIDIRIEKRNTWRLLWNCLPICVSGFLYNYLVNAPKYAIDRNMTEESQAIFSILFMPAFVINVLSTIIFKPMLVDLSITWSKGERQKFVKVISRFIVLLLIITGVCATAGRLVGTQILGLLYGTDLKGYSDLFLILLIFGGLAALNVFMSEIVTIIRKQKYIVISYLVAVSVVFLFADRLVGNFALWGAAVTYGMAMLVVSVIQSTVIIIGVNKRNVSKAEGEN